MKSPGKFLAVMIAILPLSAMAEDVRGNITCTIDDQNAVLSLHAKFSYRDDKPIFAVEGKLDIKPAGSQIAEQSHQLNGDNLLQQWFYGSDLRFRFLVPTPDGSMELAIQTTQIEDSMTYKGTYDFTIAGRDASEEPVGRDGNITCETD